MAIVRIVETGTRKTVYKVWYKEGSEMGYLRQGFAWKTRNGAEKAARKAFPNILLCETIRA